jgi:signal transduction histidine kinase
MGAISLFAAESPRLFDEHDVSVAVELGQRAGAAIEHARLYRAADARRSELTAILSAMREAVLVYDPDGQLALQNPAAEAMIAPDPPQRLEQLATALEIDGGRPLAWSELSDGPPLEVRRRDGRWLELSTYRAKADPTKGAPTAPAAGTSTVAPVTPTAGGTVDSGQRPDRRRGSTILVVRDVTSSRTAQAAREAFMGLLSHELRTPITTIYGGTRLLERVTGEEQRREIVSDVRSEAERLYRLVEDLLVMTRVERGGVEIGDEPILLQRVLGSVATVEETRWPGLDVQLRVPMGLPTVRGDPTYVEQVVRNLLTNAAKYGGVGQPVELVVTDEGEEVSVRVLDRGPGIQRDEAEHLFDLFYRGESTARTASGAGIGLFVCRALVVAMGGRMWAAPREGGGAEFGFCLPVFGSDEDA